MDLRRTLIYVITATFSVVFITAYATSGDQVVREDDVVTAHGMQEHWQLIWEHAPSKICFPHKDVDTGWETCPCQGFAFGEAGILDLVRKRAGHPDEVFPLTPLFGEAENPANEEESAEAVLQKWPVRESDYKWQIDTLPKNYMKQIAERKIVKIMKFGDYDHDGQATEFPLEIGAGPCGHTASVLIGISKANNKLHAFGTADHPSQPLVLDTHIWGDLLKSNGDLTSIELSCGDHGSETQQEIHLITDSSGIHAERLTYQCRDDFKRGNLISRESL
jgi:hypothetical protein